MYDSVYDFFFNDQNLHPIEDVVEYLNGLKILRYERKLSSGDLILEVAFEFSDGNDVVKPNDFKFIRKIKKMLLNSGCDIEIIIWNVDVVKDVLDIKTCVHSIFYIKC